MAMYDKFKPTDGQVEQKKIYHIKLSKRSPEGADRTINVLLTNNLCA